MKHDTHCKLNVILDRTEMTLFLLSVGASLLTLVFSAGSLLQFLQPSNEAEYKFFASLLVSYILLNFSTLCGIGFIWIVKSAINKPKLEITRNIQS